MKKKKMKEEESYEFLLESIGDQVQKERLRLTMRYYISNANRCKFNDKFCAVMLIVLPSLTSFVSCILMRFPSSNGYFNMIVPAISALTSIIAGVNGALKFKDNKITYRDNAECLKNVLTAYSCGKGEFAEMDQNNMDELLFEKTEAIISEGYRKLNRIERGNAESDYENVKL